MSEKKKKIFLLSDHALYPSGVGIQSQYLCRGLLDTGRYTIKQFGGAIQHDNYSTISVSPYGNDWTITPVNGFGTKNEIRKFLMVEKPDAMILFTDPRFFYHVFSMEDEIHDICPILYWNIWDNYPVPTHNKDLYNCCDALNCINDVAFDIMHSLELDHKAKFIPHTIPPGLFYPLEENIILENKTKLLGEDRKDHFVVLWINRNAKRKQPSDVIASFKLFLDDLEKKYGHKNATLLMHTDPRDVQGPNLFEVVSMLGMNQNVVFTKSKLETAQMNILHNICDCVINVASAEGFGLSTFEAMHCAKPIIVQNTGGLKRQVRNPITGEEYGIGLEPDVKTLSGSQEIPFIYDDYVSHEKIKNALMKMFEFGKDKRKEIGLSALKYVKENFDYNKMIRDWDDSLEQTILNFKINKNSNKIKLVKI